MNQINIVFVNSALRLHDNEALNNAASDISTPLLPLYLLHPRELGSTESAIKPYTDYKGLELGEFSELSGFPRMSAFRRGYLQNALHSLKSVLRERGSDLAFSASEPNEVLDAIHKRLRIRAIYLPVQPGTDEESDANGIAEWCRKSGATLYKFHQHTLIHPEDLPFQIHEMPEVFTPFRKKVEKYARVRNPIPEPATLPRLPEWDSKTDLSFSDSNGEPFQFSSLFDIPEIPGASLPNDNRTAIPLAAGESEALEHLRNYIWDKQLILIYKETRNELIGTDFSTKLSGWLASGALSARQVYAEVSRFESEVKENSSTYWVKFELLWRDFFQFLMHRHGGKLFRLQGISDEAPSVRGSASDFVSWCLGLTESDFVNANMMELKLTGFMSNRGRQNVASFLSKTLQCDWRLGALWFQSNLLDYDVASNWGNWAYVSGVGTDPRDRVFNVEKQASMYDSDSNYRNMWLQGMS